MLVKIGTTIFDSENEPIMLILSKEEKNQIGNMKDEFSKYCSAPDTRKEDDIKKFMNIEEYKTSEEWAKEFPQYVIIDPDGWDRKNFEYSWYKELIPKDEFGLRIIASTLKTDLTIDE